MLSGEDGTACLAWSALCRHESTAADIMVKFGEIAKLFAGWLAIWMVLVGVALPQDDVIRFPPGEAASNGPPSDLFPPPPSPAVGRSGGDSLSPNPAIVQGALPSVGPGAACNQFVPQRRPCLDDGDCFVIPPRCTWYFQSEGGAMQRSPSHNVDFAALFLPPAAGSTGTGTTEVVVSTADFNCDFAAAGHVLIGHAINECIQIEGVYTGVSAASNAAAARDNSPNVVGANGSLYSPFSGFGIPAH